MKIMCIESKFRGWDIGEMQIDFCRKMKSDVPRKKKNFILEIFIPSELDSHKFKIF